MKKKLFTFLICGAMFLGLIGCGKKDQEINKKLPEVNDKEEMEEFDKELVQCLESQLGGYLVSEKDDLIEIPLSEIKNTNHGKIAYYRGRYASNHPDNKYVIVFPKNGTYESEVMKDLMYIKHIQAL